MVESIKARDLRNDYARILREVEAGASYTITHHGRPVAQITPTGAGVPAAVGPRRAVPLGAVIGVLAHLGDGGADELRAQLDAAYDPEPHDPFEQR